MKLFRIIKKGYYGNILSIKFLDEEFIRVHRSYKMDSLFFCGMKLLKKELSSKYILKSIYNNSMVVSNKIIDKSTPLTEIVLRSFS